MAGVCAGMRAVARTTERRLAPAPHLSLVAPRPLAATRPAFLGEGGQQRRHRWFSSSDTARNTATTATGAPDASAATETARDAPHAGAGPASSSSPSSSSPAEAEAPPPEPAAADPLTALKEQHAEEVRQIKHHLLTSMADFQNLQKRTERDVKSAREFALQSFAKDLVSDLDVLNLALSSVPADQRTSTSAMKDLYNGVSLTASTLEKTLKRHGVVAFDPMGETFDPNKHEATYQVAGKTPGTVFDTQKKGWMIGSRLLRPAQVGVVRPEE